MNHLCNPFMLLLILYGLFFIFTFTSRVWCESLLALILSLVELMMISSKLTPSF